MTKDNFIPFDSGLKATSNPQFVSHENIGGPSTTPQPVTPAETYDLETQLRTILQGALTGTALEEAIVSIKNTAENVPTRVALPEIKLHKSGSTPTEGQPTIEFERDEETVKRVQVNCPCGQSIHLDCIY